MTRRRFAQAAVGGLFVLGTSRHVALGSSAAPPQAVLSGTQFDLTIGAMAVNFTGWQRIGAVVNGQLPAPLLRWREYIWEERSRE